MKATPLIILLSLTLIGCGKSADSGKSTSTIPLEEGEDISTYLEKLSLDPGAPQGVGTLFSLKTDLYNESSLGLCTWFLVGQNKAMTNSHCIPENLKNNKTLNCSKYLQGKIQTADGPKKVSCKRLIYSSTLTESVITNNDYALMEVSGDISNSETFTLNRKGVTEGETLSVLSMTHSQSSYGIYSDYTDHTCLMKSSDIFGIISSPGASPLAGFLEEGTGSSFQKCKTVAGNSGSPVVNREGELIGILHGGIKEGADGLEGVTKNISIITNLRCQKFGDSQMDQAYPTSCAQESRVNGMDNERIMKKAEALVESEINKALSKQPKYLKYETKNQVMGDNTIISFDPICVKPLSDSAAWVQSYIRDESNGQFIYPTIVQYELSFKTAMDYYGNLKLAAGLKTYGYNKFVIGDLQTLSTGKTEMALVRSAGRDLMVDRKSIEVCEAN